jgi:molybdopterin converting factor small subunit
MTVNVKLFAALRRPADPPQGELPVELPAGATVADLVARLGIAAGDVGVIAVNGALKTATIALAAGDKVALFPPIAGG